MTIYLNGQIVSGGGIPIGTFYSLNSTENYVPDGSLLCDGTQYSKEQFADFWDNYLKSETETVINENVLNINNNIMKNGAISNFNSPVSLNFDTNTVFADIGVKTGDDVTTMQFVCSNGSTVIWIQDGAFFSGNGAITTALPNTEYRFDLNVENSFIDIEDEQVTDIDLITNNIEFGLGSYEGLNSFGIFLGEIIVNPEKYGYTTTETMGNTYYTETIYASKLNTCTYEEYEQEITANGNCAKFGVYENKLIPVSSNSSLTFSGDYKGNLNDTLTYSSSLFGIEVGTTCLNNNGVVSNFGTNRNSSISFTDTNSLSEFIIKINTGSDIDTVQGIFGDDVSVCISGGYLGCNAQSGNGIFVPIVQISQNQDIWIKVVKEANYQGRFYYSFTGDENSYIKINNDSVSTGGTHVSFYFVHIGYGYVGVGTSTSDSTGSYYPFLGTVDLNSSYYTDTQGETHYFYSAGWSGDLKGLTVTGIANNGDTISFIAKSVFKVPTLTTENGNVFVSVANGTINESLMDWSAWQSSLEGKANKTDIPDLTDYVKNTDYTAKITNCLLEVPQRINLELNDNTLTLKAGSVVIVPYGTENLTTTYPIGSTFIDNNFKVVDSAFSDSKFTLWVELQTDLVGGIDSRQQTRMATVDFTRNNIMIDMTTTDPTATGNFVYYDATAYKVTQSGTTGDITRVLSLPFGTVSKDATIGQVFNGMGYIGSTVWVDKGVKGLVANGRNANGTYNNLEKTRNDIAITTLSGFNDISMFMNFDSNSLDYVERQTVEYTSNPTATCKRYYDEDENYWYNHESNTIVPFINIINLTLTYGKISNFEVMDPFKAVDYNKVKDLLDVRKQRVNRTSGSGTISIGGDSSCNMYYHEVVGATTISLVSQTSFSTFELCLKMSAAYSIILPSEVIWLNNETPDMSEAGVYYLVFRYDNVVGNWYANLQGMWSL